MAAPDFAELEWSPSETGGWTTEGSSAFWDYYNLNRGGFKALGFVVSKPSNKWLVTAPDIDDTNRGAFRDLLSGIAEQRSAGAERHRAALAAQETRDAVRAAQRAQEARAARERADALVLEAQSLRHSKKVADARTAGQVCLEKWRTLVHRKATLADLVRLPLLTHAQIDLVYSLVRQTEAKAGNLLNTAAGVRDKDCVTWADDVVERAVRYLTALDDDHAELPNHEGWSPTVSGSGHWCVAMFDTNRPAALRLARTLVGSYRRQLSAILTPEEMS